MKSTPVPASQTVGVESKCYPFQRDLVLPFVPKSRNARVISFCLDDKGMSQSDQAIGCLTKMSLNQYSFIDVDI